MTDQPEEPSSVPTTASLPAPEPKKDPEPPATIPWIQALGVVGVLGLATIDAFGPPDFTVPREAYLLMGAAIVSLGPEQLVQIIKAWRKIT